MQLKLTWRIEGKPDIDILVCTEQTIAETLQVLLESGFVNYDNISKSRYVRTLRQNQQVNTLLSYDEAAIYTGDIIELI